MSNYIKFYQLLPKIGEWDGWIIIIFYLLRSKYLTKHTILLHLKDSFIMIENNFYNFHNIVSRLPHASKPYNINYIINFNVSSLETLNSM